MRKKTEGFCAAKKTLKQTWQITVELRDAAGWLDNSLLSLWATPFMIRFSIHHTKQQLLAWIHRFRVQRVTQSNGKNICSMFHQNSSIHPCSLTFGHPECDHVCALIPSSNQIQFYFSGIISQQKSFHESRMYKSHFISFYSNPSILFLW